MRARWRKGRGTAMSELVIISPIFVIVWASINHFRNDYLMAQQVLHESRTQAWAYATSGKCTHGLTPSVLLASNLGSFGVQALGMFEVFPNHGSILNGTASIDARVTRPGPSPSPVYGFLHGAATISGRTFLHCNDTFPTPDNTALPWMLPLGLKELGVQP
jgi:hypothetical protein